MATNVNNRIGFSPIETPHVNQSTSTAKQLDWYYIIASIWMVGGLWLDTWAHSHGVTDDSFFTPWHAALYSGSTAVMAVLGYFAYKNYQQGLRGWKMIPQGYAPSAVGAAMFSIGGVVDMFWHTFLGVEADLEALMSPPHLTLMVGMFLLTIGPASAAWGRSEKKLKSPIPVILSMAIAQFPISLLTSYGNPTINIYVLNALPDVQKTGFSAAAVWTAFFMGFTLLAVRRWSLPFGFITLMWFVLGIGNAILEDTYEMLLLVLIAGLIADTLNQLLKPHNAREVHLRLFAFTVPVVYYCLYYTIVILKYGRIAWTVPLWAGTIVLAGLVGLACSYLIWQPKMPEGLGLER